MKIGPKGQVVIPHYMRKALGVVPGSDVLLEMTETGILIEKGEEKTEEIFREIARDGPSTRLKPHDAYEEELRKRLRRFA